MAKPLISGNLSQEIRNRVRNPDGSISTVQTIGVGTDKGETVIPTIVNGKRLSEREAIDHYNKTGENFGTFKSVSEANQFARDLHDRHARLLAQEQKTAASNQKSQQTKRK